MDQIFSVFFTKPQGSGTGLAISRSIASHGEQLWASANSRARNFSFHPTDPGHGVIALGCLRHFFISIARSTLVRGSVPRENFDHT
jgi:signal transduction histidine kinase